MGKPTDGRLFHLCWKSDAHMLRLPSLGSFDMHRAIETRYAQCRFRSRTEARWAVFFDALGIKWDYEPEGYELPSGRYLPDFFLRLPEPTRWSGGGYWVEIKGAPPTPLERQLLQELCTATGHHGYLFYGRPCENVPLRFERTPVRPKSAAQAEIEKRLPPGFDDDAFLWTVHAACINFCASPIPTPKQVVDAAEAARSARFEFKDRAA